MMPGDENGPVGRAGREPMRQRLDLLVGKRLLNFDPARLTKRRDGEARTIAILRIGGSDNRVALYRRAIEREMREIIRIGICARLTRGREARIAFAIGLLSVTNDQQRITGKA